MSGFEGLGFKVWDWGLALRIDPGKGACKPVAKSV